MNPIEKMCLIQKKNAEPVLFFETMYLCSHKSVVTHSQKEEEHFDNYI